MAGSLAAQGGYGHHRAITISHSKVPNTDQTNFPVSISGTYSYLATAANGGAVQNANGYDIVFTSDAAGANPLSFEREKYVAATGEVDFWVRIPTLSHTADTAIYMWYGNASVVTDQAAPAQVWDSYYEGVWHFANGTALSGNDSTSNGFALTNNGSTPATPGQIDGAASFNGTNQDLTNGALSIAAGSSITISYWNFVATANLQSSSAFTIGGADLPNRIQAHSPWTDKVLYWDYGNDLGGGRVSADYTSYLDKWSYVALVYNAGSSLHAIYLNGAAVSTSTNSNAPFSTETGIDIGHWAQVGYQKGNLDEFRVSNVARSADWIATEYNNQSSPGAFYTIGAAGGSGQGTVSTPTFSVPGGSYTSAQTVVISTTTSGATIRYTLDGSTPSETNGTVYSGPVTVASSLTLQAIAYLSGWNDSLVASAIYTIAVTPPTTIASSPTGQQVTVDGAGYTTPQTFNWAAGSQHTTMAPATIAATGMQGAFAGWSDAGAATHTITVGPAGGTYTASYTMQYYLTTAATGPGTVTPSSNWYAAGAQVAITATANAGGQFQGFTGTTSSSANPLTVTMNGPVTETAQFATAPSFSMMVTAASPYPVTAGASASYTVAVTPLNGFSGAVGLVASGQPAGASVSFNPPTVTIAGTATVTSAMTVTTWASGAAGTFALTVTATGGGVTQSGAATLTVGPPPVFTIAPLPAQNPYASGWQIVQQGAPMVYTVLPPPGYTGWIQLSSVGVGCVINAPVYGVSGWGTVNADGSLTVTVAEDSSFPASGCAQQSLKTYGNKIYLNLAIAVYGVNPPVNQQTFNMPLEVTTVPAISLAVSQLSQTGGMATYLATVSTGSAGSYGGVVTLGLQAGSCAKLMGPQPTVSLPTQPVARVWVLTAGCAPGTNTTLTFTAGNATVQADPQTVTLQTAPAAAVIGSPAPGSTIPGGPTIFNWNTVTGGTYCLYTGTVQQASCSGTAQPGVQVTLPLSGVVYATLGTQVGGGAWQYEQCVYTVNPSPSASPLVASGTTLVHVPNNGVRVRGIYHFSSGDPTLISTVSTGVTGLTATVVGVTPGTATIEFQASGTVSAGSTASMTAMDSGDGVLGIFEGEETVGGPTISVSPGQGVAGTPFTITETDGIVPAGPATPATLLISGDCPFVEADWQDYGFPGYTYYSQSAGNCTAQLFLSGDYAIALGLNETEWVWSDLMGFTVTAALPPGATAPTVDSVIFDTPPVPGLAGDGLTITGSNFGPAGFVAGSVQVCRTDDGSCTGTGPDTWDPTSNTIHVWWNIPTWAAGITFCVQVTTQFTGGGVLRSLCSALFYVPPQGVNVAMKLESLGTVISPAASYSEDTTIRVTAVIPGTQTPITAFLGAVKIAEDGTQIYSQNGGCLVFVQNGCSPSSSVMIAVGGTATFLARSLAGPKTVHVLGGPPGEPPDPALIKTTNYPVEGGASLPVNQWIITNCHRRCNNPRIAG
jgi:hypothetical protein